MSKKEKYYFARFAHTYFELFMTAGFYCEHFADKHFYGILFSFSFSNNVGNTIF